MPNKEKDLNQDLNHINRIRRIIDFNDGNLKATLPSVKGQDMLSDRAKQVIGSRTTELTGKSWINFKDRRSDLVTMEDGKIVNPEKSANQAAKTQDYIGSYYNWNGPLRPEYDMQEPMAIFDTESYVKQTINRRLSLMFRNGYEVIGRERDVEYINDRISTIEYVSNRSFRAFMKKIMFCLLLQGNCFLLKIRKPNATGLKKKDGRQDPVSGYQIIPAHQIQPYMKVGVISKWRRYYDTGKFFDEYEPKEVIHFKLDHKPWHIYGTPRTVAVREDIFALRRLEENTELLFINYLFPLFHVKVGTELNPATYTDEGLSELELVKFQIENMPKEGVFVTDERTEVSIVGAQGQVLDFMSLIKYYRERVFAGLGISEMDMGSSSHGGSAVSDNISQNLKDAIKADVEEFTDQVKYYMFKEWFMEANYSVSVQSAVEEIALTFHEIDLDNRIKEESHVLNLFNNNLITYAEARKRIRLKPITDQKDLHINRNTAWLAKVTNDIDVNGQIRVLKAQKDLGLGDQNTTTHKTTNGNTKKTVAIIKKSAPKAKAIENIVLPINQHGQKTSSQKVGHDAFAVMLKDNLLGCLDLFGEITESEWELRSSEVIDKTFTDFQTLQLDDSEENSYTKHLQEDINKLKAVIASVTNFEELEIILDYALPVLDGTLVLEDTEDTEQDIQEDIDEITRLD